jgi:phosphoglycerate kinase
MALKKLSRIPTGELAGKKVLLRVDFNVPLNSNGEIVDDSRILKTLPTIHFLLENNCAIVLISHLGRPKNKFDKNLRLDAVAEKLSEILQKKVQKCDDSWGAEIQSAKKNLKPGEILLLENLRFHIEETENEKNFVRQLAENCELFVFDAFGCAHRAHASTVGVAEFLPAFSGFLVEREAKILSQILKNPPHPVVLISGGAKIGTKIGVLENFLKIADKIFLGGGIANTFLHAQNFEIGASLCEKNEREIAAEIWKKSAGKIILPIDFAVAPDKNSTKCETKNLGEIAPTDRIFDAGEKSRKLWAENLVGAQTVIFNGPVGFFENPIFEKSTRFLLEKIAENPGLKIIGGGDSIEAIKKFKIGAEKFSHISTGGGAMLKFLEGAKLPALEKLRETE